MRTEATITFLIDQLQANCGDIYGACKAALVSPMFVEKWRQDDKEVDAALTEAARVGAYMLESEAVRRAVKGDEEAVYFKGEVVGFRYPKSDGLLQTLLKGRIPERYGKEAEGGGISVIGGQTQINIMPRAENYDDWLRMKDSTLALRARNSEAEELALAGPSCEAKGAYVLMSPPDDPFASVGL